MYVPRFGIYVPSLGMYVSRLGMNIFFGREKLLPRDAGISVSRSKESKESRESQRTTDNGQQTMLGCIR